MTAARMIGLLDLTSLGDADTTASVDALCRRASGPWGRVAAVCLWPRFVAQARAALDGSGIAVAAVANFPGGKATPEATAAEAAAIVADGGDEVDLVWDYRAFLAGDAVRAQAGILAARAAIGDRARLKVILETGAIEAPAKIRRAAEIAIAAGADFVKTSTGKIAVGATLSAAAEMIAAIKAHQAGGGRRVGFKASGGIRTLADARSYVEVGRAAMGEGFIVPATFRFGASGLLDDLIAHLGGASDISSGSAQGY